MARWIKNENMGRKNNKFISIVTLFVVALDHEGFTAWYCYFDDSSISSFQSNGTHCEIELMNLYSMESARNIFGSYAQLWQLRRLELYTNLNIVTEFWMSVVNTEILSRYN